MRMFIDAIYEDGVFRPLAPVSLPEGTRVVLRLLSQCTDEAREEWMLASEHRLAGVWNNEADDVYNQLL